MKYAIVTRTDDYSNEVEKKLNELLIKKDFKYDTENPELIFTIGGDGTVLQAVNQYLHRLEKVMFIGIHTGRLGFYTDWLPSELTTLVNKLSDEIDYVKYPLLEVDICGEWGCKRLYALNEMTLINPFQTQHIDLYINDCFFESFRGTGLCVCTPTGSTAYNKSLGGAILSPSLEIMEITEIGSINNNAYRTVGSPVVLGKDCVIKLKSGDFDSVSLTTDHLNQEIKDFDYINCGIGEKHVRFASLKNMSFWDRVKKSFL